MVNRRLVPLIGICVYASSILSLAIEMPLTPAQQDAIAVQCKNYVNTDPYAPMTQTTAQAILPQLQQCVKYESCQNPHLSGVPHCARKLATLYFSTKLNSLSSTPTAPSSQTQHSQPVTQSAPTPSPAANVKTQTEKPKKQEINWY